MLNNNRLFLDVHVIQTIPPSNINRDDTGSPKTAQYGGVRRARVSSQAWKRAMRQYFYDNSEQNNVGVRTKEIVLHIAKFIRDIDSSLSMEDAKILAKKTLEKAKIGLEGQQSKALFFLSSEQARNFASAALKGIEDKHKLFDVLRASPSLDVALFGRMVAMSGKDNNGKINEDASSQVAHAISTHSVQTEFDYFTAMDDLKIETSSGAAMIDTNEFNSSTLYRYANVAIHELTRQLGNEQAVINTLKLFVEAFSNSLPTGKVNTFANQTLPQVVLVTLREDRPVNLVSAFEKPVKSNDGYVNPSIGRLFKELEEVQKFVGEPARVLLLTKDNAKIHNLNCETVDNLEALTMELTNSLTSYFTNEKSE